MMNQLKSIYNGPFKDSHSHPIHTCFLIIASNGVGEYCFYGLFYYLYPKIHSAKSLIQEQQEFNDAPVTV